MVRLLVGDDVLVEEVVEQGHPYNVLRSPRRDMANLRIKLVKSLNGRLDSHIATAQSLGLHKIGNETVQPDNPQTRGKIAKIGYLLKVTEE